jgi:enoyl-[acyl-carrier-protein] reductase (NADH)
MEGLRRQWAIEFGKQGIRAITLKTGGIVDSMPESTPGRDQIAASILESAMLNHTATLEDVGNVAAFVASDQARTMTSTEINISGGAIVD